MDGPTEQALERVQVLHDRQSEVLGEPDIGDLGGEDAEASLYHHAPERL
jgi:hypothetical protein